MAGTAKLEVKPELPLLRPGSDGAIRVGDTRVTLDVIVSAFESGLSPEEILTEFDVLDRLEVYSAITFYLGHKPAVQAYLDERQHQAEQLEVALGAEGRTLSDEQKNIIKARWKERSKGPNAPLGE